MSSTELMSYVGMATGFIGAITGISGAIISYISYRRSNNLKSLDLRIELRKAINVAQASLHQLAELIVNANKSRQAVASAMGMYQSGMMEKWKEEVEADNNTVKTLFQNAPSADNSYDDLTPKELETMLVEVHRLQVQIDELSKKYVAAIQADDEIQKHIREDALHRVRQGKKHLTLD